MAIKNAILDSSGNYINNAMKVLIALLIPLLMVSCKDRDRNNKSKDVNTAAVKQDANEHLQGILHKGSSMDELVQQFGHPFHTMATSPEEVCCSFVLPQSDKTADTVGIVGFSAFFVSNRLSRWEPAYGRRAQAGDQGKDQSTADSLAARFESTQPVLKLFRVSETNGGELVSVDTVAFPKLGYIAKAPDLSIYSGECKVRHSVQHPDMYTMELQLSASDADKMAELTSRSIGKQLAIVVNNEVIAAPFVSAPILNGLANVELSSSSFLVVTRSLKANLTK